MISPGAISPLAVLLAVLGACCFGTAAVLHHRAVRHTVGKPTLDLRPDLDRPEELGSQHRLDERRDRLGLRHLRTLLRRPLWLAGSLLMAAGAGLHIVALVLAPVSLIQPIGVLAVPVAVLLAAALARRRPSPVIAVPIVVCILGVGLFVWLSAGQRSGQPATSERLLVAEAVIALVITVVVVVSTRLSGWLRCLSTAVAGAMALGLVSTLVRGLSDYLSGVPLSAVPAHLLTPLGLTMIVGIAVAAVVGGWLVQQAYASGPPEVVLACLTVVDPMVAVLLGFAILHEGNALGLGVRSAMIGCGLAAAVGVAALARHHPEAAHRRAERRRVRLLATVGDARSPGPDHTPSGLPAATPENPYRETRDTCRSAVTRMNRSPYPTTPDQTMLETMPHGSGTTVEEHP